MESPKKRKQTVSGDFDRSLRKPDVKEIDTVNVTRGRFLTDCRHFDQTTCKVYRKDCSTEFLPKEHVLFHRLEFGKGCKELPTASRSVDPSAILDSEHPKQDFVQPRSFNQLHVSDRSVTKSSELLSIHGELFFYTHMPADIAGLFPNLLPSPDAFPDPVFSSHYSLISSDDGSCEVDSLSAGIADFKLRKANHVDRNDQNCCADFFERISSGGSIAISMRLIEGPTFSHLLTNRCLTSKRLLVLLQSLHQLHKSRGAPHGCTCSAGPVNIYDNYARKVNNRRRKHCLAYAELVTILTEEHFAKLNTLLRGYEDDDRGKRVKVVHGDPVLTNCLLQSDGRVKFIDMRGMHGAESDACFSMEGDAVYDLAKCWQSLSSYDFISRDKPLLEGDIDILLGLQRDFRAFVKLKYPAVVFRDVVLVAASLYTSLVPLHDSAEHRSRFADIASFLVRCVHDSAERKEADFPLTFGFTAGR